MSLPLDLPILVVDDFESMRRIVKQVLSDMGFTDITLADDGATALPLLRDGNFGLLITDWCMPQMEGIDLVSAVRADSRLKDLPVLMLTAEAERQKILRAVQAGVDDYVVKPFTPDVLRSRIGKVLARRAQAGLARG